MSTALGPAPDALDLSTARLLSLSANLLPPEIKERRRMLAARSSMVAALILVLLVLVAWYAYALYQKHDQQNQLDAAGTQTLNLRQQQHSYDQLLNAQTRTALINVQLKTLLATDVQWAKLLTAVRAAQPKGVALTSLAVALSDPTAASAGTVSSSSISTASGLPPKDGKTPIGALTIGGTSTTKAAVAQYVNALGAVAGVGNTLLSGVTDSDKSGIEFTLRADLSPDALSHHYTS
jgi:Tfp pilus assembly protein PilN